AMYEGSSWRPVVAAWIIGGSRDDFRLPPFCLFGRTARILLACRHHASTGARGACGFPKPPVFDGRAKNERGNYVELDG
nr:hypothetical protein [Candidatus Sigynarchaeota archaeon]